MLTTVYYFLQVIICSAVMMGYYWIALRNKKFHQYNRFYLLFTLVCAWLVPLIKINWTQPEVDATPALHFLSVVADNNTALEVSVLQANEWNWNFLVYGIYALVSGGLLLFVARSLLRIYRLLNSHRSLHIGSVNLIMTNAAGTPFSFFRYIFWNEAIDLNTQAGQQILQHELTHVNQKHSIDKLLIQFVLVIGWFNPFFWLVKKEMDMIHEFISDQKSVGKGNTASLATMLLTAAYPQQQFALTNPFFFSPIKRRLHMLTHNKNPRFTYLRRLMVLPLLVVVTVLIAFRSVSPSSIHMRLDKVYTVVIDAGHGGTDRGAVALDGTPEKQINLQLAKLVQELNTHPNIKIKLTRENDAFQSVMDKASFVNSMNPDLFISLHCNAAVSNQTEQGIELCLPGVDKAGDAINYQFANTIANSFIAAKHPVRGVLSRNQRIYVLQSVTCPAVLIEAGFLTNAAELKKLKDKGYQEELAIAILSGIQQYLSLQEKKTTSATVQPVNTSITPGPTNSFLGIDSAGNVIWRMPKQKC